MRSFEGRRLSGSHTTPRFRVVIENPDTKGVEEREIFAVSLEALRSNLRAQYGPRAHITYTRLWESQR